MNFYFPKSYFARVPLAARLWLDILNIKILLQTSVLYPYTIMLSVAVRPKKPTVYISDTLRLSIVMLFIVGPVSKYSLRPALSPHTNNWLVLVFEKDGEALYISHTL